MAKRTKFKNFFDCRLIYELQENATLAPVMDETGVISLRCQRNVTIPPRHEAIIDTGVVLHLPPGCGSQVVLSNGFALTNRVLLLTNFFGKSLAI
jgi:dUTPase